MERTARCYLKKVYEAIQVDVKIISARSKYEQLYPGDRYLWKIHAFLETRTDMADEAVTNLIVVGDGVFEIESAKVLGKQFKKAFIKTVKFFN